MQIHAGTKEVYKEALRLYQAYLGEITSPQKGMRHLQNMKRISTINIGTDWDTWKTKEICMTLLSGFIKKGSMSECKREKEE